MESKGGGKIQRKRARATAKPYSRATTSSTRETGSSSSGHRSGGDTNQSFLQRVSSSVLGFVTPSWLTNYWTSSQKNDKVAPKADPAKQDDDKPGWPLPKGQQDVDTDEGMQDDGDADMDVVYVPQNAETKGTPFSSQKPLGTSTPVDDFNNRFKVCKDDASDVSMATSSVSMIPQVDITEHRDNVSRSSSSKLEEKTSAKPWINPTTTGTTNTPRLASRPQPAGRNLLKPAFNSSYFGSPISGRESPAGPFASPFYPGRTTYGGASAQRPATSSKINSPYQVYHPIRRRVKPKQASSSINSSFGVTSAAAKQILETLEKMSTPLSDAKKIPLSPTASPLVFNPSKRARTAPRPGPPVASRTVPTQASIASTSRTSLSVEEPERPRKLPTTRKEPEITTPSTAKFSVQSTFKFGVPNSIPETPPSTLVSGIPNTGSGGGGKMKSKKKSAVHISNKDDDENEMLEELDLPNVALPIAKDKMPTFNFGAPSSSTSKSPSPKPVVSTPATVSEPAVQFTFSPPLFKQGLPTAQESGSATVPTFTFSAPTKPAATLSTRSSTSPMQFSAPKTSTSKRKETNNVEEDESTGGGLKPAKELKKGSCLEVLGIFPSKSVTDSSNSGNIKNNTVIGFGDKFKKEPGTWNCSTCLLDNKPDAKTCIACMAAKPKASNGSNRIGLKQDSVDSVQTSSIGLPQSLATSKTCTIHLQRSNPNQSTSSPIGFGDKFKPEPGSWKCDVCLLNNKPQRDTCIACAGPKPPTEKNTIQPNISLAEQFKLQKGSWTCEVNKEDSIKFVACTAAKPATKSQSSSLGVNNPGSAKPPVSISSNTDLSHLKPPSDNWTCSTCLIRNKPSESKCIACSAGKPTTDRTCLKPPLARIKKMMRQDKNVKTIGAEAPVLFFKAVELFISKLSLLAWQHTQDSKRKTIQKNDVEMAISKNNLNFISDTISKDETKPTKSEQSTVTLQEQFAPPPGVWSCNTCLIRNKPEDVKCVSCGSAKPGSKSETKTVIGFGDKFKPAPGSWTCDTCLIQNQKSSSKCVACGAIQPGCEPQLKPPPESVFKFGGNLNQSSSAEKSSSAFKFGGTAPPSSGGFTFGGSEPSKPPTGKGFTFGKPLSVSSTNTSSAISISETSTKKTDTVKTEQKNSEKPTFQFGKPSSSEKPELQNSSTFAFGQTSEKATAQAPVGGFSFGGQNSTEKPVNSMFNNIGESRESSSGGFRFGNVPSTVTKTDCNTDQSQGSSSGGFRFGNVASTGTKTNGNTDESQGSSSGGFRFGNVASTVTKTDSNTAESQGSSSGGFKFGNVGSTVTKTESNTAESQGSSSGGFKFGNVASTVTKTDSNTDQSQGSSSGGFRFGNVASTVTKTDSNTDQSQGSSSGGFKFGNVASTVTKTNSSSSGDRSAFVFGAKSNQTNALTNSDGPLLGNSSENNIKKETPSSAFQLSAGSASAGFSFGSKNSSATDIKDSGSVFGGTNSLVHAGNAVVNNIDVNKPASGVSFQFGAQSSVTAETKTPSTFVFSGQPKESCGTGATPAKVGGFTFGSASNKNPQEPAKSTNTSSQPVFTFGAKPAAEPPTFKFGQNSNPNPPAFGGFGAASNSASQGIGNSVNSSSSGFSFGSGSGSSNSGSGFNFSASSKSFNSEAAPKFGVTSSTPNFGASVNPVAPVPRFGGQNNAMVGGSGFGVGSSNSGSFGGAGTNITPAPAFGSTAPQTNGPGGFQFNSNSNSNSNTSFQFGQPSNSSVFQFGAKNSEPAPPPSSGGFTFGSTPAAQPNNFVGFGSSGNDSMPFQSNAGANDNPFNAVSGGSNNTQGRRIIKKAQRRIRKN